MKTAITTTSRNMPVRLEDMDLPALTEACKESSEDLAWSIERTFDKAVRFGRLLSTAKSKVPHGQWSTWVAETFEDKVSLRNVQRFMQVAESNATNPSLLEGVRNLDEALGRIQVSKAPAHDLDTQLQVETSMAFGRDDDSDLIIVVQPSNHIGYANVIMLNPQDDMVFTKRPILRSHIPRVVQMMLAELTVKPSLEWEFIESADRYSETFWAVGYENAKSPAA